MTKRECSALLFVIAMASTVVAHPGPRIWLSIDGGKVSTYAGPYPPGLPTNYHPSPVFTQALSDESDDVWATDFPGLQKVPGGMMPVGTTVRYNIAGPLLWYEKTDMTRCPYFETVSNRFHGDPPVPQVAVTNELFQTRYTSVGFVAGDAAFAFNGSDGDHNHLTYTFLGDGQNPSEGPGGVYGLPLQLTAAGFTPSATFVLLLGKNAPPANLAAAADVYVHPRVSVDFDCDGDVGLDDWASIRPCVMGPFAPIPPNQPGTQLCPRADGAHDNDVDLRDVAEFMNTFDPQP